MTGDFFGLGTHRVALWTLGESLTCHFWGHLWSLLVTQHVFIPCLYIQSHAAVPTSQHLLQVSFSQQHSIQRMGQATSRNDTVLPRVPSDIKFRVLIIGRANAGKTSILQRVCDTTENPEIYSVDSEGERTRVRSSFILVLLISSSHQVQQLGPSQEVQQA